MRLATLCIAGGIALAMAVVQQYALLYYWYWTYWWLDIAMHVAGGAVIALLVYLYVTKRFVYLILLTLSVGVVWEVFELMLGISVSEPNFIPDTLIDLGMDTLGALVAYGMMGQWERSPSPLTEAHDASLDQIS